MGEQLRVKEKLPTLGTFYQQYQNVARGGLKGRKNGLPEEPGPPIPAQEKRDFVKYKVKSRKKKGDGEEHKGKSVLRLTRDIVAGKHHTD